MYFGATPFASAAFSDVGFNPNAFVNVLGSRINESTGTVTTLGKALVLPTGNRLNFTVGNIEILINQTVLANEQVVDGKGWRSGAIVERKKLNQWFFNISKFSEELLQGLEGLDNWPNKVKVMQKNWIGKSFGCEVEFKIESDKSVESIRCYTTRPDTLFGFSFLKNSLFDIKLIF